MSNQPRHVLLIEDNQGDAELVRLRLVESNSDLEVSCADRLSTGLAALGVATPEVVLLDLNLPDSYGADTFRHYCPAKFSGSRSNSLKIRPIMHSRSRNDLNWKGTGLTSFRRSPG